MPRRRPLRAFCRRDGLGAGSPSPCPPPRGPPRPAGRAACSAAPPATGPAQPHGAAGPPGPSVWCTRPRRERGASRSDEARRVHPGCPGRPLSRSPPVSHRARPSPGLWTHGLPQPGSGPEVWLGSLRLVLGPRGRRPPGLGVHRSAPWARSAGPPGSLWAGVPGSLRRRLPRPRPECQLSEGCPRHGGGCSCPRASTLRPLPATCKESQMTARRPLPQAESQHVTRRLRRSDRDASAACAGPTSGGRRPGACR